ncbi:MAG: PAS domain S-box protein [Candidatus Dormibacteraceae bacterium]
MTAMPVLATVHRAVFDALPDAVLVVDTAGTIVYANPLAEAMAGRPSGELVGQPIEGLVPTNRRSSHLRQRAAYQRQPVLRPMGRDLNIQLLRADGTPLDVDIALGPTGLGGQDLIVAVVRDITDLRRAQADLREGRESLERLVDGVVEYAVLMLDPSGHIVTWNRGAERLEGYQAEEIIGRHVSVLYPPEESAAKRAEANLHEALTKGQLSVEGWRVRKDRSRYWANAVIAPLFDEQGRLRGYSKVTRDLTDRRRSEIRMRTALEMTEATLQDAPTSDVLLILGHGVKELVDASTATIATPTGDDLQVEVALGADAERLHRQRLPLSGTRLGAIISAAQTATFQVTDESWPHYLPVAPTKQPLEGVAVPIQARGEVLALVEILGQLGGERFHEADLAVLDALAQQAAINLDYARAQASMRQMAMIEDRERIARELHDGVIQDIFGAGIELQATASMIHDTTVAGRMDAVVDRLDAVVRDLRNYVFGLRPGLLQDLRLDRAIARLAQDLEARSGMDVSLDLDPKAGTALGVSTSEVLAALNELFSNLYRHSRAHHARIVLQEERASICIEVSDDGRGFEVEAARGGGGMGLPNLRERLSRLGGTLELESTPGTGTRVRLHVPRRER